MTDNKHYTTGMSIMRVRNLTNGSKDFIYHITPASKVLYDEIQDMFKIIKPRGDNNYRQAWFKIARGSYMDYGFESEADACDYFDLEDPSKLQETFEDFYSSEEYWVQLESVMSDNYSSLGIKNFTIIDCPEQAERQPNHYQYDLVDWLTWIKNGLAAIIEECKNENYNDRIDRELPYTLRYGAVTRKVYWDHNPDARKSNLKDLTPEEISAFIELINATPRKELPAGRIKDMTLNMYFEYAYKAFKNAKYDVEGMTPFRAFMKYGEDFGGHIMEKVDHDDPAEFMKFYTQEYSAGGHPWGLVRGSSRSRIMLTPRLDENGFYFTFSGDPNWSVYEIVKMYPALLDAGLPISIYFGKDVVSYLLEEDLVGFVPETDMCVYKQGCFADIVNDFYHFDPEEDAPIKDLISWKPVDKIYLLDEKQEPILIEALGYVRFENQRDRFGETVNKAARRIARYCDKKGYPLMDLYRDWSKGDEFSGEIEYIRTHLEIRLFHVLIVDTIDHLGKDPDFLIRFVTLLNENGKKVYEVERDIEITPELIRNGG